MGESGGRTARRGERVSLAVERIVERAGSSKSDEVRRRREVLDVTSCVSTARGKR
jgi:hypothetical protein